MKKIKMSRGVTLTFQEGYNKYLENCRQRNLREGTINHYRQSYLYFYKYFDPKMPIEDTFDEKTGPSPLDVLARVSNVDSPLRMVLCDNRGFYLLLGVDNRKRGLGKMLDIKDHEE